MFSLEKHLDNTCLDNPDFGILNSIWKLNKKQLPLAQNAISFNFPHYSLHEKSHSDTIIKNIESFLGEDRIRKLSATDTWMLLMSAYTHDLGMVVFHSALEKDWIGVPFQNYLEELSSESIDGDLKNAAQLLIEIENNKTPSKVEGIKLPLAIRQAVILITADFFRKKHHVRSQEIIKGQDTKFHELLNGFNLTSIPNRFSNVLADVCFSHGTDFYSILESLEYQSNGYGNDKMHPRFLAFMLRLGDLLDIDDKRFNMFDEQVLGISLPHVSSVHKEKHASTKHLLITPESIEATVDCQTDEVYRIAREWFDWLQQEVEKQNSEWASIAPKNLNGMPPTISKNKLKVLYKSSEPKKELMNLRFTISNKKVFEMFEGSAIYEKAEFVFIREMVQNALDASKIQMWKYIQQGLYDHLLKKNNKLNPNSTHEEIIESIKFPPDIPEEIFQDFQVELKIDWASSDEKVLKFEVIDKGTGISEKDLIRMTNKVGESRSGDFDYIHFRNSMPYWLQPTGAFGIGLQSIFLLTPWFLIQTKSDNENGYEIIFQSAKRGEYSKITAENISKNRGTTVIINLPKEKFSEVFSPTFDIDIIDEYDHFTDLLGDIYIHKIKKYILEELSNVQWLKATLFKSDILIPKIGNINEASIIGQDGDDNILCTIFKQPDNSNLIRVHEKKIGSEIHMKFHTHLTDNFIANSNYGTRGNEKYYVRDIPVDEKIPTYYKASYFTISWNLQSPKSDKILNISRDKLISKTKIAINEEFINEILPDSLKKIQGIFESYYGRNLNHIESVAIEYFHLELTACLYNIPVKHTPNIYNNFVLPINLITDVELNTVSFKDFFAQDTFYFMDKIALIEENQNKIILKDEWKIIQHKEDIKTGYIIWDKNHFEAYLKFSNFYLTMIKRITDETGNITLRKLEKGQEHYNIETNENSFNDILSQKNISFYSKRRELIIPIPKYDEFLSVHNVSYDGFSYFPPYSNRCIISPFTKQNDLIKLACSLEDEIKAKNIPAIKSSITPLLEKYVPVKLVEWVLKHNAKNTTGLTAEIIQTKYIDLMCEMLTLFNFQD